MTTILEKYARLLVDYCLEVKEGDRVFIRTTTLAEPLVREIYRLIIRRGGFAETQFSIREQRKIFFEEANDTQLQYINPSYQKAIETYECYLYIMAPFNLMEEQGVDPRKQAKLNEAVRPVQQVYFKRTADRSLRRNLCLYPTLAGAQNAGMSLEDYEKFVFQACNLYAEDPIEEWLKVRQAQKKIVDLLNQKSKIRYLGPSFDITFSTAGRTWINSDGQTNMPSGEVYTSPVETSANGHIHFSFPGVYMGKEVEGVTLWVKDGYIEQWEATKGKEFLDEIFKIKGARVFGEAAIGTNNNIRRITKNILFDEKMGGSVHMAIGQSYLQAGGKNESPIHWDMITDMTAGGQIFADDEKIYENGNFVF